MEKNLKGKEIGNGEFLTRKDQQTFLKAAKRSRNYNQYALIPETGLRTDELIGLTWDAVDFEKRTLTATVRSTGGRERLQRDVFSYMSMRKWRKRKTPDCENPCK